MANDVINIFDAAIHSMVQPESKILVAVSGGMDSMVLLHLFAQSPYEVAVAHCNFQLRGDESDDDEAFVKNYCFNNGITFFHKKFDTLTAKSQDKTSTQLTARHLRYAWFYDLCTSHGYQYLATAHHSNDNAETVLHNLIRDGSVNGLQGIPAQTNQIIRPLLHVTVQQLLQYAQHHHLQWRTDSSNASTYYTRNKIRHHILPAMALINPQAVNHIHLLSQRIQSSLYFANAHLEQIKLSCTVPSTTPQVVIQYDFTLWLHHSHINYLLHYCISPYGFGADTVMNVQHALHHSETKKFLSPLHYITTKGPMVWVHAVHADEMFAPVSIEHYDEHAMYHGQAIYIQQHIATTSLIAECMHNKLSHHANFDAANINFPLILRSWHAGDSFCPLGMNGRMKKLSDFFIDLHIAHKQHIPLLVNNNGDIVWVIGYRIDERYKITDNTKQIISITIHKE